MPYINEDKRPELDRMIEPIILYMRKAEMTEVDGELNYILTRILKGSYKPRYFNFNRAIGMLSCVMLEFYRKSIGPYEDVKERENGIVD
jgi:hypothetical protein